MREVCERVVIRAQDLLDASRPLYDGAFVE